MIKSNTRFEHVHEHLWSNDISVEWFALLSKITGVLLDFRQILELTDFPVDAERMRISSLSFVQYCECYNIRKKIMEEKTSHLVTSFM